MTALGGVPRTRSKGTAGRNVCNHAWSLRVDGRGRPYPAHICSQLAFVFPGQGSQSVGMGRALAVDIAGRRGRLRRRRRGPRRADQRAGLGWPGRAPRPDREGPAGHPGHLDRDPRGAPRALGARRARGAAAGVRGRAFDGPVLGARRGRRPVARRRRPPRARAWPADAGVRAGTRRGDGRADRARRRTTPRAGRRGLAARRVRRRQPQRPGPGRRLGRAAGDRGRRRARPVARREAGDRPAGLGRGPLPADGRGGRRDARRAGRDRRSPTRRSRSWPMPTAGRSRRPRAAAPSSSST